jgi:hypothetical protein
VSRIVQLLALLALILAPMAVHRAEAAPAAPHHAASAEGDCGHSAPVPDEKDPSGSADCALACSAMPGAGAELCAAAPHRLSYAAARAAFFAGTAPGSDPPPPRLP